MRTATAASKPIDQDWHKAQIKAALEQAGWTIRRLAKFHQVSPTAVNRGLHKKSPISEQRIAAALGKRPAQIWPSRYTRKQANRSTGTQRRLVQKSAAR